MGRRIFLLTFTFRYVIYGKVKFIYVAVDSRKAKVKQRLINP